MFPEPGSFLVGIFSFPDMETLDRGSVTIPVLLAIFSWPDLPDLRLRCLTFDLTIEEDEDEDDTGLPFLADLDFDFALFEEEEDEDDLDPFFIFIRCLI